MAVVPAQRHTPGAVELGIANRDRVRNQRGSSLLALTAAPRTRAGSSQIGKAETSLGAIAESDPHLAVSVDLDIGDLDGGIIVHGSRVSTEWEPDGTRLPNHDDRGCRGVEAPMRSAPEGAGDLGAGDLK